MTDCETLSTNARKVFESLQRFFPPDGFKQPQWLEEGIVIRNGRFDLRKSADRSRLTEQIRNTLGYFVELSASGYRKKNGTLAGFELDHFGMMIKEMAELLLLLNDLDFQIETLDFAEA